MTHPRRTPKRQTTDRPPLGDWAAMAASTFVRILLASLMPSCLPSGVAQSPVLQSLVTLLATLAVSAVQWYLGRRRHRSRRVVISRL
jgi:hypothetical protein